MDKKGEVLGTVDHLVRNTWTGEVSKYMVGRKASHKDLIFSPQDVLEATATTVRLNVSIDELIVKYRL